MNERQLIIYIWRTDLVNQSLHFPSSGESTVYVSAQISKDWSINGYLWSKHFQAESAEPCMWYVEHFIANIAQTHCQ